MTPKQVYKRAAEFVDKKTYQGCCGALYYAQVPFSDEYFLLLSNTQQLIADAFTDTFCPNNPVFLFWMEDEELTYEELRNRRVIALLLMAEMEEA